MNMGHHVLPSARRTDSEVTRYVRSEYREKDPCWFPLSCAEGRSLARSERPSTAATAARCCPVMGALSEARLTKGLAPRGELAGEH